MSTEQKPKRFPSIKTHKLPDRSMLFDKIIPILFITLAAVMVLLLLFAAGVLLGVVPWG